MNQPTDLPQQLISPTAGNTLIWERPEKNIIYLMSEFIDNSKASYEAMNSDMDKQPIVIEFNAQKNFIAFSDKAEGFEIIKAIETTGRDKEQHGKTNQYFVGMKSAMNYFGDFSIIVSERIVAGVSRRFANFYIRYNGFLHIDVELKSEEQTGSSIYLFATQNDANVFWSGLPFKNSLHRYVFPHWNNLKHADTFTDYSVTETVLNGLSKYYPILTASLFERYSPSVNHNEKLIIEFKAIGPSGNNLLLLNSLGFKTPATLDHFPEYYTQIKKNDWEHERSFSVNNFFGGKNKEINQTFRKYFNDKSNTEFRRLFEDLLLQDLKKHFSKIAKDDINLGDLERRELGKIPHNFKFLEYPKEAHDYQLIDEEKWNKYPFAKCLVKIFLSMLEAENGSFSHIKFKISNLIVDEGRNIIVSNNLENDSNFSLDYDLSVFANNYQAGDPKYRYGKASSEKETGFTIIQDNRAIYHGPNYNTLNAKIVNWPSPWPEKFMLKDLRIANPKAFPNINQTRKSYPTNIGLNGDQVKWSARLFGNITIPHIANFTPGRNKSQTHNLELIQDFTLKILRDSGINVLVRWIYLIDNGGLSGKPTQTEIDEYSLDKVSKRESKSGLILVYILNRLKAQKVAKPNIIEHQQEITQDDGHLKKIINHLGSSTEWDSNDLELGLASDVTETKIIPSHLTKLSPLQRENQIVLKALLTSMREISNRIPDMIRLKKLTLDNDQQTISMELDQAFRAWQKSLIIRFDSTLQPHDWALSININFPIEITIPFNSLNWHRPELIAYLNGQWLKIYSILASASAFFKLISIKKNSSVLTPMQRQIAVDEYLREELMSVIEKNNGAYESLSTQTNNTQAETVS